jgi:hypothetical protein
MEHYADKQLGCPSLTILSALASSDQEAWVKNRDALLAVVGVAEAGPGDLSVRDERARLFKRPTMQKSSLRDLESPRADDAPAVTANSRSGNRSIPATLGPIPDHGYVELPAP